MPDRRVPVCRAAALSRAMAGRPSEYNSIAASTMTQAAQTDMHALRIFSNLRNSRAPDGPWLEPSIVSELALQIGPVSTYRDRRYIGMIAQQAATNTVANTVWGDMGRSVEISKYNSRAVAPNRPRYNKPNADWAERITPEFPESIVYTAVNVTTPETKTYVKTVSSDRIGFRNVARTSASPMTSARIAKTVRPEARRRTRRSLPCCRAMKSWTVIERSPFNALSINASIGRRRM